MRDGRKHNYLCLSRVHGDQFYSAPALFQADTRLQAALMTDDAVRALSSLLHLHALLVSAAVSGYLSQSAAGEKAARSGKVELICFM